MIRKYTTIIIITIYPLSERDYQRFGIDTFLKKGYSVRVLDICPFITPNYADIVVSDKKEYSDYKQIRNADELRLELDKVSSDNCLIISLCSIVYGALSIYRTIKKCSFDYAVVNLGSLPCVSHHGDNYSILLYKKIVRCLKLISVRAVCDKLLSTIPSKYYGLLGITPAKYYLVGGMIASKSTSNYYISNETTVIYAHSMDYDRYLDMEASQPAELNCTKYCVFIDDYLPFHPDYAVIGLKNPCSENNYYPALNKFFDYVEKKFNLKVIIAAHPRSDYNLHPNLYSDRTIISGKTNYLVRDAEFVIMHSSTAISYPVLFKKRILLITTNEINESNSLDYKYIQVFAKYFGQTPINVDEDYSSFTIPNVDEKLYEKYINDYIKMKNTPEKKIWEIFIDEIEKH